MKIIIESPLNPSLGDVEARARSIQHPEGEVRARIARRQLLEENIIYARMLMLKALREGHAPFASHLQYTQVWSEDPEFRNKGIAAAGAWRAEGDESWFGLDLGESPGMKQAGGESLPFLKRNIFLFPGLTIPEVRSKLREHDFHSFTELT